MTGCTKALATINLLGALISVALFVATWFAQGFIVRQARQIAFETTRSRMEPVVKFLENPKVAGKLPASVEEKLRKEIADYRESPDKWLLEIAEGARDRAADFEFPEVRNPLARKGLDFLTNRIAQTRAHFRKSYASLILDLRIFSGTNACAFLIAAWLCFVARTRQMRYWLGAWSLILLVATMVAGYCYVGQSWRWNILFNDYQGWFYAAFHLGITIYLFLRILPMLEKSAPEDDD